MTLTENQRRLVVYALRALASNVDFEDLDNLGRAEIDAAEHGDEDSGFTDADADQLLESRQDDLEEELEKLADEIESGPHN